MKIKKEKMFRRDLYVVMYFYAFIFIKIKFFEESLGKFKIK